MINSDVLAIADKLKKIGLEVTKHYETADPEDAAAFRIANDHLISAHALLLVVAHYL